MSSTRLDKLVDFFIVGAPKAGTSSLYWYLNEHPDVVMSDPKEPNYFTQIETKELYKSQDYRRAFKTINSEDEYHALFQGHGKRLGECSVSYLFYPQVAERIFEYNSDAKIIICLRDPVERALSHFDMDKRLGFTSRSIEYVLNEKNSVEFQQYIECGKYTNQVVRYLNCFPRENIYVVWFEQLKMNSKLITGEICTFLELQRYSVDLPHRNSAKETNNPLVKKLYRSATVRKVAKNILPSQIQNIIKSNVFSKSLNTDRDQVKAPLYGHFREDIISLEELMSIDLDHWHNY